MVVLASALVVAALYGLQVMRRSVLQERAQAQHEIFRLKSETAGLISRLAELDRQLDAQQREIGSLRSQVGNATKAAEGYRVANEQRGVRLEHSISQEAQLLDELQNREKQLAESTDEVARINQLRATDQASMASQQARINEISDQLRIASATLDTERQLSAAGRDIRELMMAHELHVVDVRDLDANGKPSEGFARIFLTERTSLVLYAFDLNGGAWSGATACFQLWGEQLGKRAPHSLGVLSMDNKSQRRWALKINDSRLLSEIDSVFITASESGCGNIPRGQRLLYAYLGPPNHP
jgi:regulator of replication initiation timing